MIYRDNLISITDDEIIFEHYYFPSGKRKVVRLSDIESIVARPSTLLNGKWRIHGSGNFRIWFPKDIHRPQRDKIFFAKLRSQRIEIGFTVEDSRQVERVFRDLNFLGGE